MRFFFISLLLPFTAGATDISVLNTVANMPGFSFKADGTVVTDWNKSGTGRPGFDGVTKYSINSGNFLNLTYSKNSHVPTDVLVKMDSPKKVSVYSWIDNSGALGSITKCTESVCMTATRSYCNRIYREFNLKNGTELAQKIAQCVDLKKIVPSSSETMELDRVKNRALEKGLEISRNKVTPAEWAVGKRDTEMSKEQPDSLKISNSLGEKLTAISELCNIVQPNFEQAAPMPIDPNSSSANGTR